MPELPEVETIRRQLAPRLVGCSVTEAWAFPSAKFDQAPAAIGSQVVEVRRRGKYLLVDLRRDGGPTAGDRTAGDRTVGGPAHEGVHDRPATSELVVHLGMTGRLAVHEGRGDVVDHHPHLRAWWSLDDGRVLTFHDTRRFGRIAVVPAGRYDALPTLAALGPEPDDEAFTGEHLRRSVNAGRRRIKTALLSQRPVAGVGNIYADEALWRAGVDPRARRLTRAGADRLRDAVREVLREGIDHGGTTLRDYVDADGATGTNQHRLDCYGRAGQECHRCGTTLRGAVLDARSTTWCPTCQPR
ncbi:bifunctional DNA-formamidopyrimidine glycosylase/DNA-(apurinic or apyrimidinic site) lyase [Dermatobacter hominis]|uniref:bifunctional DNA-formamidopyrimidine glycosylase/DNA-(apurinic or apyrimidinic site) lyase n=1 Tax=Dermatobacter hominis TaxID=2884263 RepID=UPI001D0F4D3E|nr:bifunctional DNA-formamidopyrimidine glycosylase/DNA-(apurinic or apyrimidinic site) lyase [Dermatobacter hominis]UDY34836.1 bifunctional DNA-formamidopyrimidine glycosylase/DNA-(apurinic or apyrimidinic site) lyase [Dermatobacter hominis]